MSGHKRSSEHRPGWNAADWHCTCGAFGSHGWMGFAFHVSDLLAEAAAPEAARETPASHRYDHDGMWRHHHHYYSGDPVWWLNVDEFGGIKQQHGHAAQPPAASAPEWPDGEEAVEQLAREMAVAGYADPDSVEQWRAPTDAARAILAALQRDAEGAG